MTEEIKEDVKITVKETAKDEITDVVFTINTLDTGRGSYITEDINGILEAVILESNLPVQVYITLANNPNIILFDSYDNPILTPVYLPLRVQGIDYRYRGFTQNAEKWVLNDKLKCEVEGPLNATVSVTIRYC